MASRLIIIAAVLGMCTIACLVAITAHPKSMLEHTALGLCIGWCLWVICGLLELDDQDGFTCHLGRVVTCIFISIILAPLALVIVAETGGASALVITALTATFWAIGRAMRAWDEFWEVKDSPTTPCGTS